MTMTLEDKETVPYGMRALHSMEQAYHPADDCHIDPETQMITERDGKPLSHTMETRVTTSQSNKHANGQEEWGSDDF